MTRFKDSKVKKKLTVMFSTMVILILVFAYMCITSITTMTERHKEVYDEYGAGASYLGEITYNFELMSIKAELIMLTKDEQARENAITTYTNAKTQMLSYMEKFRDTMKDEQVTSQTTLIDPMITSYVAVLDSMIQQVRNGNAASAMESVEYLSLHEQLDSINVEIEKLFSLVYEQGNLEDESVASRSTKTTIICTALGLFMILFNSGVCVYLTGMIDKPLKKLKAAADKLALG
ncbi:MAG: MCP four helix bundle domain-containing protein, partial [Lachnospiraceae bacterium]|nr:MCP four helix bundle domain-containing protein [Lachnospiraceae bacterium]